MATKLSRRHFLGTTIAAAPLLAVGPRLVAQEMPGDPVITRIVAFDMPTVRNKVAGKNSSLDVHGDRSGDPMLRIYTSAGVDGIGQGRPSRRAAERLLGTPIRQHFNADERAVRGPLGRQTMALWDVVGKLLQKPVYELLGNQGPAEVPVYDGSIYFSDLLPQYEANWRDRFKEEIDMSREAGHTAVKVKVGRGHRWMPRDEGDARDREVVRLIREHGGDELTIGVDANNGYDLDGAKRFMDDVGDLGIAFTEEMFDEAVEPCLEFKQHLRDSGYDTLLADGETQGDPEVFRPFVEAGAIDVLQGDMNGFGIEGVLKEATMGKPHGVLVAPHNWGSLLGFYQQLHVGRGISNFYKAEHDPLTSDLLVAEGYETSGGRSTVPSTPGFGLALNEARFADARIRFDLTS